MFKELQALATSCECLNILVRAKADGELSLTFIPTLKAGGDASLAKPFTLSGTPAELETELPQALTKIAGQRETLAEQVAATEAVLAAATKEAASKGTKALKGKPEKANSPPNASFDDDDDEPGSDPESPSAPTSNVSPPAPEVKTSGALALFE